MSETKQLLDRAGRSAPSAGFEIDDLRERQRRRDRRQRVGAGTVALALTLLAAVSALSIARGPGSSSTTAADGDAEALPAASVAPLVAGDGEWYYRAILLSLDAGSSSPSSLDATYWWSPSDDSGRIAVTATENYGIDAGRFDAGSFPNHNGIDVSAFPLERDALTSYLLERSAETGTSPAPLVTPPPDGAPRDGQLWRAITDLLGEPRVTPTVRAALLDVAAGLQGSHLTVDSTDPFGRPAHVIEFGNWGGDEIERLYVDPATHELLTWTRTSAGDSDPRMYYVVENAGVTSSVDATIDPSSGTIPPTGRSLDDLRALGAAVSTGVGSAPVENIPQRCSQGGPDLTLTRSPAGYDADCFVVEAGVPVTITFRVEDDGSGALSLRSRSDGEIVFVGDPVSGPGEITYRVPALGWVDGGSNEYVVRDGDIVVGTLYVR